MITLAAIVLDAADLEPSSRFWRQLLGGTLERREQHHLVRYDDGRSLLGIQLAPGHVPPEWPSGVPGQQLHLDFTVDDIAEAHQQALDAGARDLTPDVSHTDPAGFHVYADPAGHPFCLCWDSVKSH